MNKNFVYLLSLVVLSFIGLYPFFSSGFFGYDFVFQGARLASFYKNLQEGVLLPRWAGQLNSGYGHPVLIFLYPFVFYLGSVFHFLGLSIVNSIKAMFIGSYVFSGIFMYFFAKRVWSQKIAFLVAFVYLFSPYRFVNMYDRAALGEHMALAFLPLIFWSLTSLYQAQKAHVSHLLFIAASFALTILCHNLIFLMAFPLIFVFWHYLIFKYKNKFLSRKTLSVIAAFILSLGLSAFFWVPVVFETVYTLYNQLASPDYFSISLLPLYQLFLSANYQIFANLKFNGGSLLLTTISPVQWAFWMLGIYFVLRLWSKDRLKALFLFFLEIYFLFGSLLTTDLLFPLVKAFPQIAMVQQAFRFMNLPLVASAFIAGVCLSLTKRKTLNKLFWIILLANFIVNIPFFYNLNPEKQFKDDKFFFQDYLGTADTGQLTPPWSFMEYDIRPTANVQLGKGDLKDLKVQKWQSQYHEYTFLSDKQTIIVENTLYYPEWKVFVDGNQVPISYKEGNWIGIITYTVEPGEHRVIVRFKETKKRLFGDYLSLASLAIFFSLLLYVPYKNIRLFE